ncbi:MAG: TlpA disulfide reductase family protein [bacterium]
MKKSLLLTWVLVFGVTVCFSTGYTPEEFTKKKAALESAEESTALFCDFIKNAPDFEFAYILYRFLNICNWEEADKCLDQIKGEAGQSERLAFFDDYRWSKSIPYCRGLIEKNPDMFEPYAFMFDFYTHRLFRYSLIGGPDFRQADYTPEEYDMIKQSFLQDEKYVDRLRQWKKTGGVVTQMVSEYLAYYAVYKNHDEEAMQYFSEAEKTNAYRVDYFDFAILAARLGQIEKINEYVDKYVDKMIAETCEPDCSEKEIENFKNTVMMVVLYTGKAYDLVIATITSEKDAMEDANNGFRIATLYALKGDVDKAFETLDAAIAKGFNNIIFLEEEEGLESLHSDPRWKTIVAKVKAEWDKGEADRAKAAVAMKIEKEAPDWELKDSDGKTWKLSDFKGKKIVILDFWATWCGGCKISLLELNEWFQNHKSDQIEFFCINLWERNLVEAKKYFSDKKFAMRLLLNAGDDVAQAYDIQALPYFCMIDKEGKIRYESKGYPQDLKINLTYWINDLLE